MRDPNSAAAMFDSAMLDSSSVDLDHYDYSYPDGNPGSAPPTPDIISSFVGLSSSPTHPAFMGDDSSSMSMNPSSPHSQVVPSTSVQAMRSQLIKESLRVSIHIRRQTQGLGHITIEDRCLGYSEDPEYNPFLVSNSRQGFLDFSDWEENDSTLTPEDEERRRKRRERNKVAATKCRNKKKERTQRLCSESEFLESNNEELRQEITKLEMEKNQLFDMLQKHLPQCVLAPSGNACAVARSSTQMTYASV